MRHGLGHALPPLVIAVTALVSGCSSSQDRASQEGSLAVTLGASRSAGSGDPMASVKAASVTITAIEARSSAGPWVTIDGGLPAAIDLMALVDGGKTFTLPADLLPEGQYSALQLRVTQVELTLLDGTKITIVPPGTGWAVQIPVDFGVAAGQATIVTLNVRVDLSFKLVNGQFEFEPEVEIESVEHEDGLRR